MPRKKADHLVKPSSLARRQERQAIKNWELESWAKSSHVKAKERYRASAKGKATEKKYQKDNKVGQRRADLKRLYNITPKDWDSILEAQKGRCAICGRTNDLCVDHDHTTGKIRGILCRKCNKNIGGLGDNEEGLAKALAYLHEPRI